MRYAAFISYNHRDRKFASWLHRALETYRIPGRLRGRDSAVGPLGRRLPPIFQDREELAAASDLAASVREALEQASSLIVICSPNGARSRWVNEEIRAFTALGRRHRIQCLIVSGEPNASRLPGADPDLECLPPALFEQGGAEPLASDIRPGQDGRTAAKLKLLAGVMAVGYDELRQREQARRQQRLAVLAGASAVGFVVTSALAVTAFISRNEAIAQRDRARRETLIAERTVGFVKSMFEVADPSEARGATISAREIVDRGADRIDHELAGEPSVKADLGTTLGEVYTGLGLYRRGEAIIRRMMGAPGVDLGTRARQYLALAETRVAEADDAGAISAYQHALILARDPKSERGDLISRILAGLGETQASIGGQDAAAERNITTALALDRARGPDGDVDVARDLEDQAKEFFFSNRLADARHAFSSALAMRLKRQDALHPAAIQDLNQLGSVAYMQGDARAAKDYFARVIPLQERVLGKIHPELGIALNNLARVLIEQRDYRTAAPLLRRAVTIELAQRSGGASDLAFIYGNLGIALRGLGDSPGAVAAIEQARVIAEAQHHRNLGPVLIDLADIDCDRRDVAAADKLLGEARPVMAKDYPSDSWRMAWLDTIDAGCRLAAGDRRGAARELAKVRPAITAKWPSNSHYGARFRQISARAGVA